MVVVIAPSGGSHAYSERIPGQLRTVNTRRSSRIPAR
jgi:hypothetical protein